MITSPSTSHGYGRNKLQAALLQTLADADRPMANSELAELVRSARSNVSAALARLLVKGKVRQDDRGRYSRRFTVEEAAEVVRAARKAVRAEGMPNEPLDRRVLDEALSDPVDART